MIDFCLPREELLKLKAIASSLLVLDHHKTAMEDCGDLDFCIFDMTRSGAGLAWDFAYNNGKREDNLPWLIKYIEYRDLGHLYRNNEDPECIKEILAAVDSYPQVFAFWDHLSYRNPKSLIEEGTAILRYKNKLVEQLAASASYLNSDLAFRKQGLPVIKCVNSPILQSDIGNYLVKQNPNCIGMVWHSNGESTKFSLRSEIQDSTEVSSLIMGGGGHMRASGFSVDPIYLEDVIAEGVKVHLYAIDEKNIQIMLPITRMEATYIIFNNNEAKYNGYRLHRTDGPVFGYEYAVDGVHYREEDFIRLMDEVEALTESERLTDPRWWVREWKSPE
jgi:oligoribonuclease NrnB/cAMP/cGMP phosphodiesterase (DHH superfamily)